MDERVEQQAELRQTLRDIRALPEDQRAALLLAELGAHSHAEIGGILGCGPDKVRATVFQARSSLEGPECIPAFPAYCKPDWFSNPAPAHIAR